MRTTNVHGTGRSPGAEMPMDDGKMAEVEALAAAIGNVQEACRRCGVSRSLFYKWLGLRGDGGTQGGEGAGPSRQGETELKEGGLTNAEVDAAWDNANLREGMREIMQDVARGPGAPDSIGAAGRDAQG